MCGIAGVVALDGEVAPDIAAAVPAMTRAIAHRGPDGDGLADRGFAVLGHRRLSIIDRAGGHQPMANEDESCWIVFNGEIYNHHPLRRELEARGHRFRTVSDTETILHAYEEFGPACLDRLDGMFAFAIADGRRREVFMARDRLGKKPLFYAVLGETVHFASEIKALRPSPAWDDTLDPSQLEGFISLGYIVAPDTIYRHVRKLQPGHWLRVAGGRLETRRYWDVTEMDTDRRPDAEVVAELESVLGQAVRDRLESEVPLGAFLSGGIDSGLVVSFMAEAEGAGVVTTSVGFAEREHNELDAAAATAARFKTRHYEALLPPALPDVFDTLVGAFDEPFADPSAIPTYYVSKAAREHVTVALSGDGGDEAFAGYDFRYRFTQLESKLRRFVPGAPGRAVLRQLGALWPRSPRLPRPLRAGNVLENLGRSEEDAYYADLCFVRPWDARRLLGRPATRDPRDSATYEAVVAPYRRCPSTSALQRAQYADLHVYLPNDPLVKVDRASMVHSLEVRCPLLDHRVIELAFRLPSERKLRGGESKFFLRQLGRKRLPAGHDLLPKRGFTVPISQWIRGPYRQWFEDDVLGPGAHATQALDKAVIKRWFAEHTAGTRDRGAALWTIWCFERWSRLIKTSAH